MSSSSSVTVSKSKESKNTAMADEGDEDERTESSEVTRHVCLSQSLEKEEILRRIRQRKRISKLSSTLQSLVRSPKPAKPASVSHTRWLDDPFTAL